jgi:hypothetical protein
MPAAFNGVKDALTHAPVLALPDFSSKPMEVRCDASITGIGAVLVQEGRPLAFESRRLDDAQMKWTTTEQELYAVHHALTVWRCYLEGVKFTVVTDHNPLVHLPTQPNLSRKQARWVEYLQRFDFNWEYRSGKTNVADPLSRVFEKSPTPVQLNAITLAVLTRSKKRPPPPPPNPPKRRKRAGRQDQTSPSVDSQVPVLQAPLEATQGQVLDSPAPGVTTGGTVENSPVPRHRHDDSAADLVQLMQAGYSADPWFTAETNIAAEGLERRDDLWWKGTRVAVPNVPGLREGILYELHNAPYSGHPGMSKTLKNVGNMYWWPTWRQDVDRYVKTCLSCQRNKASNQKPGGLLQPLPIPEAWDSVGMDFIVQLPCTEPRAGMKRVMTLSSS